MSEQEPQLTRGERNTIALVLNHFAAGSTPESREADLPRAIGAIESILINRLAPPHADAETVTSGETARDGGGA